MEPILSVIVPVYKVEPYLRKCLDSIVFQTYKNLEIILVDDGSPDKCGEICDEYATRDARVMVIHKVNGGLSAARNDGLSKATGKWVTFVDSDDWIEPDYYEAMLRCPGAENADVICANGCFIEDDSSRSDACVEYTKAFYYVRHEDMKPLMIKVLMQRYPAGIFNTKSGMGAPWDKLFSLSFLRRKDLWFDTSSKAWEDLWFVFQAFDKAERVSGILYTGYHYRKVATSITKGYNQQKPQINYDFLNKLYSYLGERVQEPLIEVALEARALLLISNSAGCYFFHKNNPATLNEKIKGLYEMIQWPLYHEAIYSKGSDYLPMSSRVWKYLLRWKFGGGTYGSLQREETAARIENWLVCSSARVLVLS